MSRARAARARDGWTRLSAPGDKLHATWRHDATGWLVKHCGHQTALRPYFAVDPEHPRALVVRHNGGGFGSLAEAFEEVEALLAGRRRVKLAESDRYEEVRCLVPIAKGERPGPAGLAARFRR